MLLKHDTSTTIHLAFNTLQQLMLSCIFYL